MSRYLYNVAGDTQSFTVGPDIHFITIDAAGGVAWAPPSSASTVSAVEIYVVPVSEGDEITIVLGGYAAPGSASGGINGGGNGHGGTGLRGPLGYPLDDLNPSGDWTTAGAGCTEVFLNGTLVLVAGGASGRTMSIKRGTGTPPPWVLDDWDPGHYGDLSYYGNADPFPFDINDQEGVDATFVANDLPDVDEPNRVPQDSIPEFGGSPLGLSLLSGGNPGGTKQGGSGQSVSFTDEDEDAPYEWATISTVLSGAGGGGYGGGAGGALFQSNTEPGVRIARRGKQGTSYAAYPHRDLGTSIPYAWSPSGDGVVLITWVDKPEAVLNGPEAWSGNLVAGQVPSWVTWTIWGSKREFVDALGLGEGWGTNRTGNIYVAQGDYDDWVARGELLDDPVYGNLVPAWHIPTWTTDVHWQVIEYSTGDTVHDQTDAFGVLTWLTDYVAAHGGDAPAPGRYKIRMRLRTAGLDTFEEGEPIATFGPWSEWAERDFTINAGGPAAGRAEKP